MARAIWSGTISFGLVSVPVKVFTAVREHTVHFHQVEKSTGSRIRYEKVSERSGEQVPADQIGLGYQLPKSRLVTVDPGQIDELRPRSTRAIEIEDFVDIAEIDPAFYDRTYWLAPDGEAAARPYSLLARAMIDRKQVGIGTVVMRNKQYLAAIRPRQDVLALSTMHFADELVSPSDAADLPPKGVTPDPKEVRLAIQIIDALSTSWDPRRYRDTYTDQVKELIERQAAGKKMVVEQAPVQEADMTDLVAALEASLQSVASKAKAKAGTPTRRPARRSEAGGRSSRKRTSPSRKTA